MNTATALAGSTTLRDRRPQIAAGLVSLLLHALLVWWLLWTPWSRELPLEPLTMVIEVVPPPAVTPAPPPSPPPPVPEPPQRVTLPPAPPQLTEAPIAERSTPPPSPRPSVQPVRPRAEATAPTTGARAPSLPRSESGLPVPPAGGRTQPGGAAPYETATQKVQEVILAQVRQRWVIDVGSPRFRDIEIGWRFILMPDGTLGAPFGANDPWDLRAMVRDYEILLKPGNEALRTAIETFIQATRLAQPFRLPPDGKADEPRVLPLVFRLGDL